MDKFSFSRLNTYETCPRRFYYRYVLGKEEPDTQPLALGRAVHKAIELVLNGLDLNEAVKEGYIEADFHPEVTLEEITELVQKAPFHEIKGETERYFCIPLFDEENSPMLQGYIDLVDGDRIYDFKTNWSPYNIHENHQVALYAWALSEIEGHESVHGSLLFLRFGLKSTDVFNREKMDNAIEWARGLVREILAKLEKLQSVPGKDKELFPYKASSACGHCPFVLDCFKEFSFKKIDQ